MTTSSTEPGPTPPRTSSAGPLLGAAVVVGLVLVGAWFLRPHEPETKTTRSARRTAAVVERMVGDRACAECHPGESAAHARSGHARTLRRASERSDLVRTLADRSVVDPEHPGVTWTFRAGPDKSLALERSGPDGIERLTIDHVFGSGHHACTFVSVVGPSGSRPAEGFEHRITYFADGDRLGITPGQTADSGSEGVTTRGRHLGTFFTYKCFECHTTLTSTMDVSIADPAHMLSNVRCERCHGAGKEHVESARAGREPAPLTLSSREATADKQMRVCGQCHRHPDMAPPGSIRPDNDELVRFQPVGLMQSACYRRTPGGIGCTAFHDPHRQAASDAAHYGAVCLNCHKAETRRVCPKAPENANGCVGCHMPKRDSGQSVGFTDHWIRVRGEE